MPPPKKRSTRRRSRRLQRKVGGAEPVFVLYESGEHLVESPKLISVFRTRDAAVKKVGELIEPMNIDIKASVEDPEDAGEFIMEAGDNGMVAYSERKKCGFYVKELPFVE
jgi:hypothetical protein